TPFLAMKLIRGRTLADLLAERGANGPQADRFLPVFEHVCQAVGYAHSRGVIHRDLKPSNVMVGEFGEVQVMDWGLAKEVGSTESGVRDADAQHEAGSSAVRSPRSTATQAGAVVGTPAYMSPEQARGEPADERSDVFALGGILCAILTGKPPNAGSSPAEALRRSAAGGVADSLATLRRGVAGPRPLATA